MTSRRREGFARGPLRAGWVASALLCASLLSEVPAQDLTQVGRQKPFSLQTNLSLNTSCYSAVGIPDRQQPFSWTAAGSLTLGVYGLQLPISFAVGENERSFRQPFDQFGLSPTYKWITLHGGYRSLTFSPFTLAGHTFLGGGVELNPSILRSGFVIGRFERAVQPDSLDTLHEKNEPAYTRYGWAAKLGVGKPDNYADLIVLKAWDDTNSVKHRHDTAYAAPPPEENVVVGLSTKNTLWHVVTFTLDAAVSGHTRDMFALAIGTSSSMTLEALRWMFDPNLSTTVGYAVAANLDATLKMVSLNAQYKRVDPEFASLGAYFMETDLQSWSVTPSVALLGQKLRLTGSLGLQNDDLAHQKTATTYRWRAMGGANYMPTPLYGVNAQYSALITYQRGSLADTTPDTAVGLADSSRLDQTSHQVTLAPFASFTGDEVSGSGSLAYSWSYLQDNNRYTRQMTHSSTHTVTLAGQIMPKRLELNMGPSLTYAYVATATATNQIPGLSLSLDRQFLAHTLRPSWSNTWSWSIMDSGLGGFTYTSRLNCTYALGKHHAVNVQAAFTRSVGHSANSKTFSEFSGNLGYTFTF